MHQLILNGCFNKLKVIVSCWYIFVWIVLFLIGFSYSFIVFFFVIKKKEENLKLDLVSIPFDYLPLIEIFKTSNTDK